MSELGGDQGGDTSDSRETNNLPDSTKGLGQPVEVPGIVKFDQPEFATTGREVPVHVSDKPAFVSAKHAHRETPTVVTKTIRVDRVSARGEARDAEQVELKLKFSVDRSRASEPAQVKIIRADKAARESPAAIKALSEWFADDATKSFCESLKAGLPEAEDKYYLITTSDLIADGNEQAHQLVGSSVEGVMGDVDGLPPGFAEVTGDIAAKAKLPYDDPIENTVTSLRVTGIAIDILSGGLPIAELLDLAFDAIKKAITEEICEALSPQSRSSEMHVTSSSKGMADVPGSDVTVVSVGRDSRTRSKRIEEAPEPPRHMIEERQSLERPRPVEGLDSQTGLHEVLDPPPSIRAGPDQSPNLDGESEPPSISVGQPPTAEVIEPLPGPGSSSKRRSL